MKILLEESDLLEIVTNHVKSTNLLNLANKEFNVELEIDGTEVTASIQTSAASLTPSDKPKKKTTKRKASKTSEKSEEPTEPVETANDEKDKAVEDEVEIDTSTEKEVQETSTEEAEETPEEDEVVEDKPPFFKNVKPSEPVTETEDKPRKSLFK